MSSIVFLLKMRKNHYANVSFDTVQEYKRWIMTYHDVAVVRENNMYQAEQTYARCDDRLVKINRTLKELYDGRSE